MKTRFAAQYTRFFFASLLAITTLPVLGNDLPDSTQAYWVVETNAETKNYSIIRFYNGAHELIYEEKLTDLYLDVKRRKTVKMLNQTLEQVSKNALIASQVGDYSRKTVPTLAKRR